MMTVTFNTKFNISQAAGHTSLDTVYSVAPSVSSTGIFSIKITSMFYNYNPYTTCIPLTAQYTISKHAYKISSSHFKRTTVTSSSSKVKFQKSYSAFSTPTTKSQGMTTDFSLILSIGGNIFKLVLYVII